MRASEDVMRGSAASGVCGRASRWARGGAVLAIALAGTARAEPPPADAALPAEQPARLAQPAPKFTLLTRGHAPEAISLLSVAAADASRVAQVVYLDAAGKRQTKPLSEIVALAPPSWVPTPETIVPAEDGSTSDLPVHALTLVDGERLIGSLVDSPRAGADKTAETPVFFKHERLGVFALPLDRVAGYTFSTRRTAEPGEKPPSPSSDTVLLLNTDRLEGLVTRLGPVMAIEIAAAGGATPGGKVEATEIDIRKVAVVHLVNPATPLKTLRVDLADGSIVAADRLSADTQSGRLALRPLAGGAGAQAVTLELSQLAGVVPDPSRIRPLSSVPIAAQKPASGRVGAAPAQVLSDAGMPLSAADIVLPGPMGVEWTLPAGVSSVSGYAQMDDRSFAWGDCTVVVSIVPNGAKDGQERELARQRLNATTPTLVLSADLGEHKAGDRLRIRTEPGARGPIQDRVVLRRMLLLGAGAGG